jgi:hypothetical protein
MKKNHNTILLLLILFISCFQLKAQDLIVKTNRDTIKAKITEVGTNAISFKKWGNLDGPTFVESKSDILFIKYNNGEVQQFSKAIPTNTASIGSMTNSAATNTNSVMSNTNAASSATQQPTDGKIKIERTGSKYTINGQKASRKMVNEQLGKSKNPAIQVPLKATKMMGGAQKIVKITSIPTTIGGGFTFLWKGIDMWNDIQRGRATTQSYVNAALSLVGTLTLPITNKILKKKSNKMYDKLIDLYNVTN